MGKYPGQSGSTTASHGCPGDCNINKLSGATLGPLNYKTGDALELTRQFPQEWP